MAFIYPDEALETFMCDQCHKFLSVTPVKEYPDKTRKCGRCSIKDDGGTCSEYGVVSNRSTFKCINRFDGCIKLLLSSQVIYHENVCTSRYYRCPLCPAGDTVYTFEMTTHFNKYHPESVLTKNHFVITNEKQHGILLYKQKEFLFYIFYRIKAKNCLSLEACLLRGEDFTEQIIHQFFLYHRLYVLTTENYNCTPYSLDNFDNFVPREYIVNTTEDIRIHFEVNFNNLSVFFNQPNREEFKEQRLFSGIEYFAHICRTTGINWPYILPIFDGPAFDLTFSEYNTYITKTNQDGSENKVFVCCFNCYRIDLNNSVIQINNNYYGICDICVFVPKTIRLMTPLTDILPIRDFSNVDLLMYCPVEGCNYSDSLSVLQIHTQTEHNILAITTNYFSLNFLYGQFGFEAYVFVIPYFVLVKFSSVRDGDVINYIVTMATQPVPSTIDINLAIVNKSNPDCPGGVRNVNNLSIYNWYADDFAYFYLECDMQYFQIP